MALSQVLCGEGCEVEALAGGLWSATSSKGYKTVLATHGFTAGTFRCEVKLHRLSSGAGARLGYATETVQLGASVGADPSGFAIVSATGLAVTAGRSSDVVGHPTAPFKEGDTVGLCLHLPAAAADNDEQQPCDEPSDVVALTAALDARAGWSRHGARSSTGAQLFLANLQPPLSAARHKPGQHVHTAHTLPGSAMSYNVNGGAWRVAFQDGIPASQRMHAAISLFTDPTRSQIATQACAIFNPGPVFAFDAPTCASMPPPRPLSELGPTLGPVGPPVEPVEPATAPEPLPLPLSPVYVRNES